MKTINLPIHLDFTYHIKKNGNPKRVFLLLHGYLLDGQFMIDTISDHLPEDSIIIAPNGAFLVPQKKEDRYFPKYSWYFFDPHTKSFYINYDPAAQMLNSLLVNITKGLPVTIIGYSQGGYIAPKVAELNKDVDTVIGLACIFRPERFLQRDIAYHQIHSDADLVVNYHESKSEFQRLEFKGRFLTLRDEGHKLNASYLKMLKSLL